jgi:ATP-dependent DNA helicase RecG
MTSSNRSPKSDQSHRLMSHDSRRMFPRHSIDTLPVEGVGPDAIDLEKVAGHLTQAHARGRYRRTLDPESYLVESECVVELDGEQYATLAGILCFGIQPQRIFPHAVVDLGQYRGVEPLSYEVTHLEKGIGGTIAEQLMQVEDYIWRNTQHGMTLPVRGLERIELHQYPLSVIRELLVNMLAHRDYSIIGAPARVTLFHDRIEWFSPGGLPPGVTIANMLQQHVARNPRLLTILYEAGLVEAFGQGLNTVVSVLRAEQMEDAIFEDIGAAFIATVRGRNMEGARESGVISSLTESQRQIVLLLRRGQALSPRDIRAQLTSRSERSVQRDIKSLVSVGVIEQEGESVAIKYRLRLVDGSAE